MTVPTGVLMNPLSSPRQPWQLTFAESPHPDGLPPRHDIVRTGMGLGLPALDALQEQADNVGLILCCIVHRLLLIPVEAGTADTWQAPHSTCRPGPMRHCLDLEHSGYTPQCGRFWLLGDRNLQATTDAAALHHSLSLTRSRMRSTPHQASIARRVQEVTYA
ncbi:hypothetical protein ABZ281_07965 [Streptomyces sp. NPDC006265]|uniref:hypothetical protein n=1 Tax=Streptomyces sp. NPDC006265 TaxID=3156740 RepID=UPI0033BDC19E